ncbi:MAG: hypothetical protein ACI32N_10275 [Bulleidia sp.]
MKGSDGQKKFFQFVDLTREAGTVINLDEPTDDPDTDRKTELISKINGLIRDHIVIVITQDPALNGLRKMTVLYHWKNGKSELKE